MIRIIQFLIFGHLHKWTVLKSVPYDTWAEEVGVGKKLASGTQYVLRCEKCGEMKTFES